ncbi:prolyl oligopeptidase family serine peptidase [Gramella sp. GC03-9]|uniref:Prolyl oligopeptidase family serine peptidase n=1 Tax=Christiangramia oceanisediminis TaxID=2920386 RepID=A0A9X2I812_9FLAO|nr:prolyl oligopeptidase family serine peptidase [Gramella oceanisediminis]MCP9199494.1 prolyl oligopeptidase family serine peptidase [Gramella oceanisediminis]
MYLRIALFLLLTTAVGFSQQKRALTHEDYDLWKSVQSSQISNSGNLIVTEVNTSTGRGDGYLKIFNRKSGKSIEYHNGYDATISADEKYIYFLRKPDYEQIRQEKKDDVKKEKQSKNAFFIYNVENNNLLDSIQRVKKYEAPEEYSGWVVIEKFKDLKPEKSKDSTRTSEASKDSVSKPKKNLALEAEYALVYDLSAQKADTIFQIKDFKMAEDAPALFYSKTKGEKKGDIGVFEYDLMEGSEKVIDTGRFAYSGIAVSKMGDQMAYITARDSTEKDSLKFELFHLRENSLNQVTDTLGKNLRKGWKLSAAQDPFFSENAKRLFFYSRPSRNFDVDTTLLEEEVPDVDVWNYRDKLIQPEQKVKLKQLEDKAFLSYLNTEDYRIVTLHDEELEYLELDKDREHRYILGYTSSPYDVSRSWKYPWSRDFYIVDTRIGSKRLALEESSASPNPSPNGKYAVYFNREDQNWYVLNLEKNEKRNLTGALEIDFQDVENDVPASAGSYGFGGFTEDGKALIFDQYDIWMADLEKNEVPKNITQNGRKNKIEYRSMRLDRENRDQASYFKNRLLVNAFDKKDKTGSLLLLNTGNGKMEKILDPENMVLDDVAVAEDADIMIYRKSNFQNYPDLYLYENRNSNAIRLTNANPQQKDFKWGTSEAFSWTAYDGTKLEGIIYKPENFDPNKKYPLIAYFYERRSDNLHRYYSPQPSASVVNMSYLVSNDYIVFVPDIVYSEGQPGESAYNCIVSGVEALEKLEYIDQENMAIQGQSWGGYQVAYLVTKTNKFAAAMAGAPVSNMTSAYGGIRWGSGLSRAFQYEQTQSRIGKNLWEGLDLYLENSPLFGIPDIETPLLMMHNDADGAVPYYQGIEMFMGMRRLNKPAWLLVYNDEAHNLRKMKNRQDLSIRMMQFFDHYLKGEPAPVWMTEGVPAVMKGKDLQYDLEDN